MENKQVYTDIIDSAKPYFLATYPLQINKRVILCLSEQAQRWRREYKLWQREIKGQAKNFLILEQREFSFLPGYLFSRERIILFVDDRALRFSLPSLEEIAQQIIYLQRGAEVNFAFLLGEFLRRGYIKQKRVWQPAEFAVRGDIIDVFPLNYKSPVRIEFWNKRIERISYLQKEGRGRRSLVETLQIFPKRIEGSKGTLFDHLTPQNCCLVLDEPETKLIRRFREFQKIIFQSFSSREERAISLNIKAPRTYQGRLEDLQTDLESYQRRGWKIFISTQEREVGFDKELFTPEQLSGGFVDNRKKVLLLTDTEILGPRKKRVRQRRFKFDPLFISSLRPGDYVVHIDHGVAKFAGMRKNILANIEKEYFVLSYKDGDKLFLPVDQADRITRYIGSPHPQIHRLHGNLWQRIKRKARDDTEKLAKELLLLYAQRKLQKGYAFSTFGKFSFLPQVEQTFPYSETVDQKKVLKEIFQDMERAKPMDRLLVGDVGFGKTEIALRAAVKAVEDRKQVALLAPTTILSEQHYQTFQERLRGSSLQVEVINRFKKKIQQKYILERLKRGEIDIIIGTHRLLSPDVRFFDLGLLIIDEEQRFGVQDKEKLKKIRLNVDVLSLSATPIPRTLNLSLSGIRDISTLRTPPLGRRAVKTFVLPYQEEVIQQALERELGRGGQVYFLHNRVETIQAVAKRVKELVPEARLDVAHAQLKEIDLFSVMQEFNQRKIDILVCSSIIENGIDLPNVNTLIVDNAPSFGLGNLHQLRGRIGRSTRQAYAYFLYREKKLTEKARQRLQILKEMSSLGSGFEIALRDLELRGVGNILGREQAGHISALGLHLYTELLRQTIRRLKGDAKEIKPVLEVKIDLPLEIKIPPAYIEKEAVRIKYYQRIARLSSKLAIKELHNELKDRFGALPLPLRNLFKVIHLRNLARKAKIKSIQTSTTQTLDGSLSKKIILSFVGAMDYNKIKKLLKYNRHWSIKEDGLKIDIRDLGEEWLKGLEQSLKILIFPN